MTHVLDALGRIKEYWGELALADLADYARGRVIRGGAADWESYAAETLGAVLIGDGVDVISDPTPTFVGLVTMDAGLTFGGGGGANIITVPDNLAQAHNLVDAGGLEYRRIVSTDAGPRVFLFPGGGGRVTIGATIAAGDLTVVNGGGAVITSIYADSYTDDAGFAGMWVFRKSHTDTIGNQVQTINNEWLGSVTWVGVNSAPAFNDCAYLQVIQDGVAGVAFIPTKMLLCVGTNAAGPTARLTIFNDGAITLAGPGLLTLGAGTLLAGGLIDVDGIADAIVLDADGDTTISAPTDDEVDFEVGGADVGFLHAEGWMGPTFAFVVENTSGGAVAANDVGYIDSAGEFKTTATAHDDVAWCVVIEGGANNADIYVTQRGRVTVLMNEACAIGDFLVTSAVAGRAQRSVCTDGATGATFGAMRPEVFAVALTASVGIGATCSALLLCHTRFRAVTSAIDVFAVPTSSVTDWRTTIAALPGGAVVTYTSPLFFSGAENCIDVAAANQYGKLRLYNETRANYALVDDVDTGVAKNITLTAAVPGGWIVGDTITTRSQTCVLGPAQFYFDIDLSSADNTLISVTARAIQINEATGDPVETYGISVHPWQAYAGAKVASTPHYAANIFTFNVITIPLFQQRFCVGLNASGAGTSSQYHRIMGIWLAMP